MISLPNVTLVIVDCVNFERAYGALQHCKSMGQFWDVKFFTHFRSKCPDVVPIRKLGSVQEYSNFILKHLYDYIETEFVLIVQHDGFIVNPQLWTDEFLEYDYIGPPWHPSQLGNWVAPHYLVGNGGFSLRSRKLLKLTKEDSRFGGPEAEDVQVCQRHRGHLESQGIKFPPLELAHQFGCENYSQGGSFGQHAYYILHPHRNQVHERYKPTKNKFIVIHAPPYTHKSGGIVVLHYLCHLLNRLKFEAYLATSVRTNPLWETPVLPESLKNEEPSLTVLAEIYPTQAGRVFRWCLNKPGLMTNGPHHGPTQYPPNELVYSYIEDLDHSAQQATQGLVKRFCLPSLDPEVFDRCSGVERDLPGCYYIGKGSKTVTLPDEEKLAAITMAWPKEKAELALLLRRSKKFYSFDSFSAINAEAQYCGCEAFVWDSFYQKFIPYQKDDSVLFMNLRRDLENVYDTFTPLVPR